MFTAACLVLVAVINESKNHFRRVNPVYVVMEQSCIFYGFYEPVFIL